MSKALAVLALGVALAGPALAQDTVKLKNGDVLTGTLVKIAGGALVMETSYSKEIKVDLAEVTAVETKTPARVVLTSGEVIEGRFVNRSGVIYLEGPSGARQVSLASLESVGIPEVAWSGLVGATVLGTAGNSRTSALGAKAQAERVTKENKLSLAARADYQEREKQATVQNAFGRIRFDHQLTATWFVGAFDEAEHDFFKDIRIRNRIGGGPGYRFINTPDMLLSALVGIAFTHTNYRNQRDDNFASAVVSEELQWKLSERQLIYQSLDLYPSLQSASDFTARAEAGFRQTVVAGVFVDLGFIDDYNNQPASGRKSNDFRYALTLGYLW
jgi:putative salt-induced outer membrane protein YdiY